jgi:hypothetical protein
MPRFSPLSGIRPVLQRGDPGLFPKACIGGVLIPVRFCNFWAQAYTGVYKK